MSAKHPGSEFRSRVAISACRGGLRDACPQVVQLKAVFPHGAGFVLAFEFMLSDLAEVVRHAQRPLAPAQVKSYLQMLLKGVAFCHANNIVHRVSPSTGWGGLVLIKLWSEGDRGSRAFR